MKNSSIVTPAKIHMPKPMPTKTQQAVLSGASGPLSRLQATNVMENISVASMNIAKIVSEDKDSVDPKAKLGMQAFEIKRILKNIN
jgi:hypothetical protein